MGRDLESESKGELTMAERDTRLEIEAYDYEGLKAALGIPDDEVYVELAPGVSLYLSGAEPITRRGADIAPYLVEFIIVVTGQITANAIWDAISQVKEKSRQVSAPSITIVERVKLPITSDSESQTADIEIERHYSKGGQDEQ
jgi:hypothetical protein